MNESEHINVLDDVDIDEHTERTNFYLKERKSKTYFLFGFITALTFLCSGSIWGWNLDQMVLQSFLALLTSSTGYLFGSLRGQEA